MKLASILLLAAVGYEFANAALSLPPSPLSLETSGVNATARAEAIQKAASLISIGKRSFPYGEQMFPLNDGPSMQSPLYLQALKAQGAVILTTENTRVDAIRDLVRERKPVTVQDYDDLYTELDAKSLAPKPAAMDTSDANFGFMRLGIRGHNMRAINSPDEYAELLSQVPETTVSNVCGSSGTNTGIRGGFNPLDPIRSAGHLFVSDFSDMAKYTDAAHQKQKYAPNVIGVFCYNPWREQLLPLAIQLTDSGLVYTPEDSKDGWMLAKMALDATELNYQQMRHLVEVHLVSIPVQVEMMRSMSPDHPIYALLDHHFFGNFALELRGGQVLFAKDSPYDQSMGFGAPGSLRFIMDDFGRTNLQDDFPTDIKKRGLDKLSGHRYALYGRRYYTAIQEFVDAYLRAYYISPRAIQDDKELQTWAQRASQYKDVHGFPDTFTSFNDLGKILTHFIFQNSVKHHVMNGAVSWHSQAAPYSTPAIWNKPLPTTKTQPINLSDYFIPSNILPELSYMAARFDRPIPDKFSILNGYDAAPFADEPQLSSAIKTFKQALRGIDWTVDAMEKTFPENQRYYFLKPSRMPYFSYI